MSRKRRRQACDEAAGSFVFFRFWVAPARPLFSVSLFHTTMTMLLHASISRTTRGTPRTVPPAAVAIGASPAAASRAAVHVALPHSGGVSSTWRPMSPGDTAPPAAGAISVTAVAGDLNAAAHGDAAAASATDARPDARRVASRGRQVGQRPHEIWA